MHAIRKALVLAAATASAFSAARAAGPDAIIESARQVPVAYEVDVVVVGGSTWAVRAAVSAAKQGASVFLAAPRPYLGEDLCGTLRFCLEDDQVLDDDLAKSIFGSQPSREPLTIKKALDAALVDAGVDFLFGCYPTDLLHDGEGVPCGILMANRAGRQAVIAKTIVDATERAVVARMAGARAAPWPSGEQEFKRVLIMPEGLKGEKSLSQNRRGLAHFAESSEQIVPVPSTRGFGVGAQAVEHALRLPMADASWRAFAQAEQTARDQTWQDQQLRASESLFCVPPDPIIGQKNASQWQPQAPPALGHCRPLGVERLYVLSGAIDVPRQEAARLLRPTGLMRLGHLVGVAAAREALELPRPRRPRVSGNGNSAMAARDTREILNGLRSLTDAKSRITAEAKRLPVYGEYDVVVIGGGTSGAPAAIGAARRGAKTLVVEYQEGLGGIGTLGLIGKPYHGLDIGFTREVPFPHPDGHIEQKMEWYRREIHKAGGEVWLGAMGCGAVVEGDRLVGAVVATPFGRGAVLAKVVIDATGNADVAAAAGAATRFGAEPDDIALQGTGLPPRPLRKSYVNTDYLLVEEADMLDVWTALVGTRQTMKPSQYDSGTLIQSRERRRVVGDHTLTYLDQVIGRTYPDSIAWSASDYDSHGYPSQAFFALLPHDEKSRKANHPAIGGSCYTPYRCLLPRGLDGLLVIGTGLSAERDALAMVRMQRDLQNQGYSAGVAAAMAAEAGCATREIDIRALQQHLVAKGNLPEEALSHDDNFPFPTARVADAVEKLGSPDRGESAPALAVVLAHRPTAEPLLKRAFVESNGESRLIYARILGFFGDKTVVPALVEALEEAKWDEKILQGVAAEYAHLPTPVDALVLALGATRDPRAVAPILRKLELLDSNTTLSHHRSVALALEQIGDPAAAAPLARLLARPGMRGHAMNRLEPMHQARDQRRREGALREIVLARALYRCGDADRLGESILREYQDDLRGLFARHASLVLR